MAEITYPYNPFQDIAAGNITVPEIIKVNATDTRMEFVPRAAPFFSRNFKLFRQGSSTPLSLGVDYCFGHQFFNFIQRKQRNAFGSVILLKKIDAVLTCTYSTVGGPFNLSEANFAMLVANLVNSPRQIDWADLDPVTMPAVWPTDPHEHPASQVMDMMEMMVQMNSLILAITSANAGGTNVDSMLQEHINKGLLEAHSGTKNDFALGEVQNMGPATNTDLDGNSANKNVTVAVLKEALRRQAAGTLNLNP